MAPPVDPRLVRRSGTVRRHLAVAVLLGVAAAVLIVAQAWLISFAVARGFDSVRSGIAMAVFGVGGCFVGRAIIGWAHRVAAARAAADVKVTLRRDLHDVVLSSRPGEVSSGHVVALLGHGLDALDAYFARFLPQLVLAVVVPAVVMVALASADLLAAATVALTLPLIVVFMILVGWLTRARTQRRWNALKRLTHHFADVLDGLVVLKVFGRSARQAEGLREVGTRHAALTMRALRLAFLSSFVLELCATICVALVAVGVGLRVLDGGLSLQTGLFVLLLAPEAFLPVRQVGTHYHDSAEGVSAAQDAFALLERERPAAPAVTGSPASGPPRLDLRAVRVRYPGRDRDALPPTDFTVEPGELVALAGPSGSGKSTLLAVLLGFVDYAGEVCLDEAPLPAADTLRRRIAWVPQQPVLIAGTVGDNVRLTTEASDADVRAALDLAATDLPISRTVAERGANLSAGEQRRVAIARALLHVRSGFADLLLLDEPTAGLDSATEQTVIESVRGAGVSTLVVAHRQAWLAAADRTIELERREVPV